MLPWRQNAWRKLHAISKLLLLSVLLHTAFIYYICFVYETNSCLLHINVTDQQRAQHIVFLPLQKVAKQKSLQASVASSNLPSVTAQQVAVAKPVTKKSGVRLAQATSAKKTKKKEKVQKNNSRVAQKKKNTHPVTPIPKAEPSPPQPVPTVVKNETSNETSTVPSTEVPAAAGESVVYVGRMELQALEVQQEIASQIAQHFKPPKGLARNMMCDIKICVGWDGIVQHADIEKGSGVLAYDVHARTAAQALTFPKPTWGKELVLHFKS
jgi:outer membrane biosynthesis protein TonB